MRQHLEHVQTCPDKFGQLTYDALTNLRLVSCVLTSS